MDARENVSLEGLGSNPTGWPKFVVQEKQIMNAWLNSKSARLQSEIRGCDSLRVLQLESGIASEGEEWNHRTVDAVEAGATPAGGAKNEVGSELKLKCGCYLPFAL